MFYSKEDLNYELGRLDERLYKSGLNLYLTIVGGTALIFNGLSCIETEDIDTINKISLEVKEIIDDLSIDINDDAIDYIKNYDDVEFIKDNNTFKAITIEYLDLPYVILTKMQNIDDCNKIAALEYVFEELGVELEQHSIEEFLENLGIELSSKEKGIIEEWLYAAEF